MWRYLVPEASFSGRVALNEVYIVENVYEVFVSSCVAWTMPFLTSDKRAVDVNCSVVVDKTKSMALSCSGQLGNIVQSAMD